MGETIGVDVFSSCAHKKTSCADKNWAVHKKKKFVEIWLLLFLGCQKSLDVPNVQIDNVELRVDNDLLHRESNLRQSSFLGQFWIYFWAQFLKLTGQKMLSWFHCKHELSSPDLCSHSLPHVCPFVVGRKLWLNLNQNQGEDLAPGNIDILLVRVTNFDIFFVKLTLRFKITN